MYQVIIADDEELIRKGFRNFIPWKELGFEVVAEFSDGLPAIEYLKEHHVDLVFSDIKMTQASGIDIAKYIYENNLDTRVCLISGYKDFEYAREAMRYRVEHYLTKPTVVEETVEVLRSIKEQMDKEHQAKQARNMELQELLKLAQQQFLTDVFTGNFNTKEELLNKAQKLNISENNMYYCPFWLVIEEYEKYIKENWKYEKESFFTAVTNFVNDNGHTFQIQEVFITGSEILYVASGEATVKPETFHQMVKSHLTNVEQNINLLMGLNVECQIGIVFTGLSELVDYLTKPIWMEADKIESSMTPAETHRQQHPVLLELYKNVILSVLLGRRPQIENHLQNIFEILPSSYEESQATIQEFFHVISSKLADASGQNLDEIIKNLDENICKANDLSALYELSKSTLTSIYDRMESTVSKRSASRIIARAKEFIEKNYMQDISLNDVADFVFLNSAYFSRFFKQHTGENFRDYLINLRIEKAIQLMKEKKYKIYEISNMVGYKNSKYFTYQFKHVTGLSPKEYMA